jgi:outer membrane lipoprotein SlyB
MTAADFAGLISPILQTEAVLMRKPVALVTVFAALALILGGCASSLTGDTYTRDEARTVQTVRMGTIESLRPVKIEGTKTPIGAGAGAVVGGVAGSGVGRGRGSAVAAVIGAVAGGLIGAATEEGFTRTQGVEITVREDDGTMRAYVQAVEENQVFRVGQRVRIMTVNGTSRVAP